MKLFKENKENIYYKIITKSYNELIPCLIKVYYAYKFNIIKNNKRYFNNKIKLSKKIKEAYNEFFKNINICQNKNIYPKNIDNLSYWKLYNDYIIRKKVNITVVKIISNLLFIYAFYDNKLSNYWYIREKIYSIFDESLKEIIDQIINKHSIKINNEYLIKLVERLTKVNSPKIKSVMDINSLQKTKINNIENKYIYKVISYDDMIKLFVNIKQLLIPVNNDSLTLQNVLIETIINKNIPYLWKEILIDVKNKEKTWYILKNLIDNLYYGYISKKIDKYLLNQDGKIEIIIWNKNWYEIKLFELLIKENWLKKNYKSVNNIINGFINTVIEWKTYKVVDKFFISSYFINNLVFNSLKYFTNTKMWKYLYKDWYILNIYTNKKQSYKIQFKDWKINTTLIQTIESYEKYLNTNTYNENKDKLLSLSYLIKKINDKNTKLEEKYLYYYLIQYIKQKYKNKLKDYEFYFDLAKLEKINNHLDLYVNAWNIVKKIKLELRKQLLYNYGILSSLDTLKLYIKNEKIIDIPVLCLDKFKIEDKITYTDILKACKSILYKDGLDLPFIVVFTDFDSINKNKVNLYIFFVNKHNSINLVEFDELKLFTLWWEFKIYKNWILKKWILKWFKIKILEEIEKNYNTKEIKVEELDLINNQKILVENNENLQYFTLWFELDKKNVLYDYNLFKQRIKNKLITYYNNIVKAKLLLINKEIDSFSKITKQLIGYFYIDIVKNIYQTNWKWFNYLSKNSKLWFKTILLLKKENLVYQFIKNTLWINLEDIDKEKLYKEIFNKINTVWINNFVLFQKQKILSRLDDETRKEIIKTILRRFRFDFIKYLIKDRKLLKIEKKVHLV
jgi:hypothetical protein